MYNSIAMPIREALRGFISCITDSIIEPVPPELDALASAILKGDVSMLAGARDIDLHATHIEVHIPLHPCGNECVEEQVFIATLARDGNVVISPRGTQMARHMFF